MYFSINKKYYVNGYYQGIEIFYLKTKPFQFRWFTDCGEWFLYIHIGLWYWRFSSVGYMRGSSKGSMFGD